MQRRASFRSVRAGLLFVGLAWGSGGCSPGESAPEWIHLVDLVSSESVEEATRERSIDLPAGRIGRVVRDDAGVWLEAELRPEDWSPVEPAIQYAEKVPEGAYRARVPFLRIGRPSADVRLRELRVERGEPERAVFRGDVFAHMADGEAPGSATVRVCAMPYSFGEGRRSRIRGRAVAGEGLPVWSGGRVEVELAPDAPRFLSFGTCVEQALAPPGDSRAVFRVYVDGERVFEHEQEAGSAGSLVRHGLRLPDEPRPSRIAFEVDGPFAYTSFLAPILSTAEGDGPGAEAPARPDLVVFLADTFRADNLTVYGGNHGVTPNIDRFASEGLVFRRAWSVSTSTLPAHSSLFTGMFPLQTGVRGVGDRLPATVRTIAEHLSDAGYRTVAVTDGGFVSPAYGLDQGFEWFHSRKRTEGGTLGRLREALEEDDGRPLFLFVQTYRAHSPYEVSAEARERFGASLGLEGLDYDRVMDELEEELGGVQEVDPADPRFPVFERISRDLRRLYLGGCADLDTLFGEMLEDLAELGVEEPAVLFTSDHGEAFAEHDRIFHTGRVFEEQIRIPLMIGGPAIEPGVSDHAASLVDLSLTLADLAGVAPHGEWLGTSLLRLDRDRPVFAFQGLGKEDDLSSMGVVLGSQKLMVPERLRSPWEGPPQAAFDLRADPGETRDLSTTEEWPAEMLRVYGPLLEDMMQPRVGSEAASPDPARLEELRALGYGGEVD